MINLEEVQQKLRVHHYTMANDLGIDPIYIVAENESYTPSEDTPYKTMFMMVADIEDLSLAFDDKTNTIIIFQITLYFPINQKTDEINIETNNILTRFKRGTKLSTTNEKLRILKSPELADLGRVDGRNTRVISVSVEITEL